MKVIISHPTGNANLRAVLAGLRNWGYLFEFHTTIATFPGGILDAVSALGPFSELKRRGYDETLRGKTRLWPAREVGRLVSSKAGWNRLFSDEADYFSIDSVYKNLDQCVANSLYEARKKGVDTVYAYEDGALETFRRAQQLGMTCVYDLPIAFWETTRKLIREEAERWPEWIRTLEGGMKDSEEKLERKTREIELADLIVTPGSFVAGSISKLNLNTPVVTAAFGSPLAEYGPAKRPRDLRKPLRVLFAGTMGQRKGLADLFQAIKLLRTTNIELVVMGSLLDNLSFYKKQLPSFTYEPTRPHAEVLKLMSDCDVFCLPSIIEGRALVMQEAMSRGLPLIVTANTGGEDLVIEGETGFLVPIRSPEAIAARLQWCLENRGLIPQMGQNALRHAASYSWKTYADTIVRKMLHQTSLFSQNLTLP